MQISEKTIKYLIRKNYINLVLNQIHKHKTTVIDVPSM